MHSSVISKAVFILIALIMLVSCEQGGSKVKARHAGEAKSETNASSVKSKSTAKASTTHNGRVASSSTTTTNTVVYNGITQFNAE